MSRPIISFDIDGVLADGHYIPAWDRHPEVYLRLDVRDSGMVATLNELATTHNVYLVSGRKFEDALNTTRRWLRAAGVAVGDLCGIICGIPRLLKASVAELIGSQLHFDDDPKVVQMSSVRGVWFESHEWDGYEHLIKPDTLRVASWAEVRQVVTQRFDEPRQLRLFTQPEVPVGV